MPLGGTARIAVSVATAGAASAPAIHVWVGAAPPVRFTVSTEARDAFDAPTVHLGATILLDGVDVTEHLSGAIEVLDGVDEPFVTATFALVGDQWLAHRTHKTWTRTPCRILFHQGASQDAMSTEQAFHGVVVSHRSAPVAAPGGGGVQVPGVAIEAKDTAYIYGELPVCEVVEPLVGLTRDQIAAQVAEAAGVPTDIPPGALYTKGVETGGKELRRWLADFGEPENWSWRLAADGITLEAYRVELKHAPQAPDAVWTLDELEERPSIDPPSDVASTWVLRGSSGVQVDELGLVTKTQVVLIQGLYTPAVAVQQQLGDGTVLPFGGISHPAERTISRLTIISACRGDRLVRQTTFEEGFRNPSAAAFSTDGPGAIGAGPEDGYYYRPAFIDSDGRFVEWSIERFGPTSRREIDYHYELDGTLIGEDRSVFTYHRIRRAVRAASSVDGEGRPVASVGGTLIADDGASYRDRGGGVLEIFGLSERQELRLRYGADGHEVGDQLDTWKYFAVRTFVRQRADTAADWVASGYFANADGRGMQTIDASLEHIERVSRSQIVSDGRVTSETAVTEKHVEITAIHGSYDFGDYTSTVEAEPWRVESRESKVYTVQSSNQYQVTPIIDGQAGPPETQSGRPPAPLWRRSAWTTLVQTPIELVFDDDTLRQWFGSRTKVLTNDHIQDVDEASRVLLRHLLRELSHEVRVVRPDTPVRPGQTVQLLDRDQRFFRRCLLLSRRRRRTLIPPRATVECQLLAPLPITFTLTDTSATP